MKSYLALLCLPFFAALLPAATITPVSYNFGGWFPGDPGTFNYADWEKKKLTDGIAEVPAWGGSAQVSVDPFVGWIDTSATINFIFSGTVTIDSITVWAADSNGTAGVWFPAKITVTGANSFQKSMLVTDPAGAGSTAPIVFSGLNFTGDRLTLNVEAVAANTWLMLTEVSFSGTPAPIPEPATFAIVAGLSVIGLGLVRRRSRK